MTKNEVKKSLIIDTLDERLMKNLLQAKTEEERAAILKESGVVSAGTNLTELNEEELGRVAGGHTHAELYDMMCQVCGISYHRLTLEKATEKADKHTQETGHNSFKVYFKS